MKARRIIWTVLVLFGLATWAFIDYYWSERAIRLSNLTLICTKTDWTIYKPWTWVKQPVTQILWIDGAAPLPYDSNYYLVQVYSKRHGKSVNETLNIVDLNRSRFIGIERADLKNLFPDTLDDLDWLKANGCMSDLIDYLKANKGKTQVK